MVTLWHHDEGVRQVSAGGESHHLPFVLYYLLQNPKRINNENPYITL